MRSRNVQDEALLLKYEGPLSVVRACRWCDHVEIVPKGRGGGRGYGMREGNKARGRMIQHVKSSHPTEYDAARQAR